MDKFICCVGFFVCRRRKIEKESDTDETFNEERLCSIIPFVDVDVFHGRLKVTQFCFYPRPIPRERDSEERRAERRDELLP